MLSFSFVTPERYINFKCTLTSTSTRLGDRLLLQPDHDCGTICQLKSVGLICRWTRTFRQKLKTYFVCSRHQRLVTVVLGAVYKLTYFLTYLLTYLHTSLQGTASFDVFCVKVGAGIFAIGRTEKKTKHYPSKFDTRSCACKETKPVIRSA